MTDLERKYNRTMSDVEYAARTLLDVTEALRYLAGPILVEWGYKGGTTSASDLNALMTIHRALTDKLGQVYDELMATVNASCDTLAGRDQEGDKHVDQD